MREEMCGSMYLRYDRYMATKFENAPFPLDCSDKLRPKNKNTNVLYNHPTPTLPPRPACRRSGSNTIYNNPPPTPTPCSAFHGSAKSFCHVQVLKPDSSRILFIGIAKSRAQHCEHLLRRRESVDGVILQSSC